MPLLPDLNCDCKCLALHSFDLLKRGCKGIALFGTTGEGPSFSVGERLQVLDRLIAEGIDPKQIILCNSSSGIQETALMAEAALKYGCAALLVCPPSFYKNVTDAGVIAFYREVIQRVKNPQLRLILYHIPQYSGVPISLEIISALRREFPGIVIGMKESAGNFAFTQKVLEAFPNFKVFVGNERQIIEAVHLGGSGAICGVANLYPELICSLYEEGRKANGLNPPRLDAFFEAMQGIPFIAAAKAVMEERGGNVWHMLRPPLVPLDEIQRRRFISTLQKIGLE